ncbi:MAG TPA: DUF305 domain-containing protein [Gemmatimonadaceae bacterium]|nr:DUF305 domain-containing protein [Gemmatimonadaceae bacterium]
MTTLSRYTLAVLAIGLIAPVRASAQKSPSYTAADVRFMQGMIGHHAQALAMTALIPTRSSRQDIRMLGQRITVSQKDEIAMMQQWLRDRHQQVPARDAQPGGQTMAGNSMNMPGMALSDTLMPGMLTSEQLAELAKTTGDEFDKLFLADMIRHHEGALVMVKSLLGTTGSGQEAEVFRFASEVDSDQRAEIARMNALLDMLGASGAKTQH